MTNKFILYSDDFLELQGYKNKGFNHFY